MNNKKPVGLIVGSNIALFLLYFIGFYSTSQRYDNLEVFFISMGHALLCLITAVISGFLAKDRYVSLGFTLSCLILLILGFSSCFGFM